MATLSHNDIAKAIYLAGEGKKGSELSKFISDTVRFLARKNLISKSEAILNSLKGIVNKKAGVIEAEVWSKGSLGTHAKHQIKETLKKRYGEKEFVFIEHLDPSLIGGFKIKVGDEMMDFTLKNKINSLKDYLIREK